MGVRWATERAAWAGLDRLGEVEVYEYSAPEEVPARAAGAAVLVVNKAPIGADADRRARRTCGSSP